MNSPYGLPSIECLNCHLRPENFFCALSEETLKVLSQIKHAAVYPEHAVIVVEGQPPRGIFMLCQGQAKLSANSQDGKSLILRIVKAGDVLGLQATITGRPYGLTVETMQPCQFNFVSREDFLPFIKQHGDACLQVAQHISRDYHNACEVARTVGLSRSISERLAKFLLDSSAEGEITDGVIRTKLALTHDEIGQLIGTCRESITRTLSQFREMKIVELKGSTLILRNKTALGRLCDGIVQGSHVVVILANHESRQLLRCVTCLRSSTCKQHT